MPPNFVPPQNKFLATPLPIEFLFDYLHVGIVGMILCMLRPDYSERCESIQLNRL